MPTHIPFPLTGPGSQPEDADGSRLDYMEMPSGMMTFSTPELPEPEDISGLAQAIGALDTVLAILKDYQKDEPGNVVSLDGFDQADLDFIDQVLGEGEVSVICGATHQVQEAVLAGVWRVKQTDETGRLVGDYIEVGQFPTAIAGAAFAGARGRVEIPESFGPDIFNAPPLLPEINDHVSRSGSGGRPHVINLSLLPHTQEDLALLNDLLGRSGLTILSRGYGNCRVTGTTVKNTWWVQYYNSQDALILNAIEITPIPDVVCAAPEDLSDSAERLEEILEVYR